MAEQIPALWQVQRQENDHGEGRPLADLRFERSWFWVMMPILAWVAFWRIADEHMDNPHAQALCWFVVIIAVWAAGNV